MDPRGTRRAPVSRPIDPFRLNLKNGLAFPYYPNVIQRDTECQEKLFFGAPGLGVPETSRPFSRPYLPLLADFGDSV